MITSDKVTQRYARALILSVEEELEMLCIEKELQFFSNIYVTFQNFFENPIFESSERISIIERIRFNEKLEYCLKFLIKNRKINILKQLPRVYSLELNKKLKRANAFITIHKELDLELKKDIHIIIQSLSKRLDKFIYPLISVDSTVLSGIRIQIDNLIFDNTLISKFLELEGILCN